MPNIIDILEERGFIEAITHEELRLLTQKPIRIYCGFDPSSDSLHLGNLIPIIGLAWFQRFGHTPVAIVGGATGMIGDPSGKAKERQLLDEETLKRNIAGIQKDLETILNANQTSVKPLLLNNYDWMKDFTMIDFLRDVGKYFRLGPMLAKDSVRLRLNSEEGLSFTEFSYQLLQAYDFLYLNEKYSVEVQIGGSDQWGNITAGIELTRKVNGKQTYGVTFPLLTTSDGKKFGKSEEGAIWLSPEKVSPFQFYQYLVRVADDDVIKLMRLLTFMDMEEIRGFEQAMKQPDYAPNTAQRRLAEEVTRLVHGEEGLRIALKVTEGAKPGSETFLDAETLETIARDMPSVTLNIREVLGVKLIDLLVKAGVQESKGQARKLIQNGGFYLNNAKVIEAEYSMTEKDLIERRFILLGVGKKNKTLIRLFDENI